jgi:polar amino acid transport system substrate-binding protein/glutamate/aspartate transport system substrate-binding protein
MIGTISKRHNQTSFAMWVAYFLPVLACLALVPSPANAGTLDRVRETGSFKIGYRADAKPYSYRDDNGQPAGYIVDLCLEVAAAVRADVGDKVVVEYVLVTADQRFESVRDGKVDILCDPSSVTLPRREMVDFSLPTFLDGASVLYRMSKPVQRFEDLAGKRVGVLSATTTEKVLRESLAELGVKATIVPVGDHGAGVDLLWDDKLDAYFADRAIIAATLKEGGRPGFQLSKQYFSYETYALALPRDDGAFRLLVDRTLARLYRTGRINAILARTFGRAPPDEMLKAMILINSLPDR